MLLVDRVSGDFGHSHSVGEVDRLADPKASGHGNAAMLGLVVHAAVDGVALGATIFSGSGRYFTSNRNHFLTYLSTVPPILFFWRSCCTKVMLPLPFPLFWHFFQAPAAFGLATYLMQRVDSMRSIKSQLLVFSLAAPIGNISNPFS